MQMNKMLQHAGRTAAVAVRAPVPFRVLRRRTRRQDTVCQLQDKLLIRLIDRNLIELIEKSGCSDRSLADTKVEESLQIRIVIRNQRCFLIV